MINRLSCNDNPNFFLLTYDYTSWSVNNFIIIPKHYFTSEIIIKRKPLPDTVKRAGWTGCNINISRIPESGRIYLVKNSQIITKKDVHAKWKGTEFLRNKKGESKGWILDIMNCVDTIQKDTFSLNEMYSFEKQLKEKYPNNNFIKDKIRQQLQILRDKGLIEFKNRGTYKKVKL